MANSAESDMNYGPQRLFDLLGPALDTIEQADVARATDGALVSLLGKAVSKELKMRAAHELNQRYPGSMTGLFDNSRTSRP